jgi:hypothetical protein
MRSSMLKKNRSSISSSRVSGAGRLIAATAIIAGLLVSATPANAASRHALPSSATSHGPKIGAHGISPGAPRLTAKDVKPPKAPKYAGKRAKSRSGSQRPALRSSSSTWKYLGHTGGYRVGNKLVGSVAHYWTGKSNGYSYVIQKRYYCDLFSCTHSSSYWAVYQQGQWWGWYQYCTPYNSICIPAEFPID